MGEADQAVTRRRQPADTEDEGLLPGSVTSDLCCPEGCWPKEVDRAEACVKVRSGERGVRGAPVVAVKVNKVALPSRISQTWASCQA